MTLKELFKSIANVIREQTDSFETTLFKAKDFPTEIGSACHFQYEKGYRNGNDDGYFTGREEVINQLKDLQKGTVSGEAIGITDISPIEHNMGVSVSTKNIIKFPYYNASGTVSKGVTYTVNADGSVTANGTAISSTSMYCITEWTNNAWLNDWFEDGQAYVIGGSITTPKVQVILQCKRLSDNKDVYYYGNGKPFTIDKNTYKYCFLRIQVEPNTTVDNVTIYPIINKGTVVLPYAQRIEDISTVKLYKGGKNLADSTLHSGGTIKKDTYTEITYKLNSVLPANIPLRAKLFFEDETRLDTGYQLTIRQRPYYQEGELLIDATNKAVTLTAEETAAVLSVTGRLMCLHIYIYVKATGGATYGGKVPIGLMITLDTPTEYEPYIEPVIYDVNADGTVEGVNSIYPNTTLYTDTQGAVIDCDYIKDLNIVVDDLTGVLLSLGGDV